MNTSKCIDQYSFIKSVEQHIGTDHLKSATDRHLVSDIVSGVITTYKDAAQRYTQGNIDEICVRIDGLQREYTSILLNMDVYHNDAQRITSAVGISWEMIKKMLHLGYRKGAIERALETYDMAMSCHAYDIGAGIAASLSHHYGQHHGDEVRCDLWYQRYEYCIDQEYMVQDTRHSYSKLMTIIKNNGKTDKIVLAKLRMLIEDINQYRGDAGSYMYWSCYYKAKIYLCELEGDFESQVDVSLKAYEYFVNLPLFHHNAGSIMLAQVVHAHNLLYQYQEALTYHDSQSFQCGPNRDLLAIRLARSYINTDQIPKAIELIDSITKLRSALIMVDLYKSYCIGENLCRESTGDESMQAAYFILDLYLCYKAGGSPHHEHEYLLSEIRKLDLIDTREGLIIEILSLLRFQHFDPQKYTTAHDLIQVMCFAPSKSTEVEILRYETMIEELFPPV